MQVEINLLKTENFSLKEENKLLKPELSQQPVFSHDQYATDDDELAEETNWILKKRNPKKRKADSSPEIISPTVKSVQNENPVQNKHQQRPPPNYGFWCKRIQNIL